MTQSHNFDNYAIRQDLRVGASPTFGNLTITSFAANWTNAGRTVADLGTITTADINGGTWQGTIDGNWTAASQTCANLGSVTTADINGGTIDGTSIGASSASTGKFTSVSTDTITESTVNAGVTVQSNKIISNSSQLTAADITGIFGNTTTTYVWNIDSASSESQTDIIGSKALTVVAGELESANDVLGNAKFCKWSDGDTYLQSTDAVFNVANTADTDDFLVGGWVYIPDVTPASTYTLLSNIGVANNGWRVEWATSGRLYFTFDLITDIYFSLTPPQTVGWVHMVFAREVGVGVKAYVNGQLAGTGADATIGTTQSKFQLGGFTGASSLPEDDTRYDEVIFRKGVLPTNLDDCVRELYARSAKKFAVKDANNTVLIPQNKETFSSFSAYLTDAQSIGSGSRVTVVFATKVYDILNEYNNTTGIFTAQYAGIYQVNWQVASASAEWASGEYWIADLVKNNSSSEGNTSRGFFEYSPATVTRIVMSRGSAVISLAAGDTLKIQINHNQGGAVNTSDNGLYNLFQVARVS